MRAVAGPYAGSRQRGSAGNDRGKRDAVPRRDGQTGAAGES